MSENRREFIAERNGTVDAAPETAPFRESASRNATFKVQFSKFWTTSSPSQNSFDLARRGEIAFSGERFVVRGFRREMLFMGSRIELAFERAHVADVSQSGNCLRFSIAPPGDCHHISDGELDKVAGCKSKSRFSGNQSRFIAVWGNRRDDRGFPSLGPKLVALAASMVPQQTINALNKRPINV